jgi:hypothetical protein
LTAANDGSFNPSLNSTKWASLDDILDVFNPDLAGATGRRRSAKIEAGQFHARDDVDRVLVTLDSFNVSRSANIARQYVTVVTHPRKYGLSRQVLPGAVEPCAKELVREFVSRVTIRKCRAHQESPVISLLERLDGCAPARCSNARLFCDLDQRRESGYRRFPARHAQDRATLRSGLPRQTPLGAAPRESA